MPFEISHYAHTAKTCDELADGEIVAFGDGRMALAFASTRVSFCWSHLIDLGSFEVLAVDDLERLPAAVLSLGTEWLLSYDSVTACAKSTAFLPGNLLVDDRGTWLIADGLQRFGLAGSCRGDEGTVSDVIDHRTFRVPGWKLSRPGAPPEDAFVLKVSEGKRNAGWFPRKA